MIAPIKILWLIPVLPLIAAAISSVLPRTSRRVAASLAIGAMAASLVLAVIAFAHTLPNAPREVLNFKWFDLGTTTVQLGFILDPLTALMAVMVTFVSLLIFIYSVGYMANDENFARYFCFLSLFAAAMLGIVVANSLLLLFISWELVGLSSYLLIGFWYHKPSAAAACKKAFITTRIGDIGFFLGILWLYSKTGTLLFYDNGAGCLEQSSITKLLTQTTLGEMAVSTAISLLLFCGAAGKSGQLPLHVWLPDAMEGPTPVSALIHAATMVAAGVFLVARVYPLMSAGTALHVVTWVGAITAVFAASIAVAQNDIKRILAYSTVSQLGYMMMGLGVGGVSIGMFHLITHAFFKALLFLGAGSVIHGCHEEQDIRNMGGLRKFMPVTFVTYAVGMMALCGVPLVFSGFWSKDAILHAAHHWEPSSVPFLLGVVGAFLTAFYMTRQVYYVFFKPASRTLKHPHESPRVMTVPLAILAVFAIGLGVIGTPAWPWFQSFLGGEPARVEFAKLGEATGLMLLSTLVVACGMGLSFWVYRRARNTDPLEFKFPFVYRLLERKYFVDEIYEATVIRLNAVLAKTFAWIDEYIWGGLVSLISNFVLLISNFSRESDEKLVNSGFDEGCATVRDSAWLLSKIQNGQIQRYMRAIGLALCLLVIALLWGCS